MTTIETLQADGWKEYPDQFRTYARCFYKRFDTPTRCSHNNEKQGNQVCIAVSDWTDGSGSIEMDLYGGLSDESSIKIHNYGLPNNINKILLLVPRLLAVWECAANYPSTEQL